MCEYRGKVILVVNTASQCGFTPQYAGLETDFENYDPKGFVILGFPCNQFGMQEPGDAGNISDFCTQMYGITFPMFQKIDVNGMNADPLYVWLKAQPGGTGDITWNFNKFLLGRDGKLIKRYDSTVTPEDPGLNADIQAALAK
jgi:glutathione peroxidase